MCFLSIEGIVPTTDDPNAPSLSFRVLILGTMWCILLGAINSLLSFRTSVFGIPSFLATLLSYPMGIFMAQVLPIRKYRLFGFEFTLNPGPFGVKEHVLITIIASAGGSLAYGIDNVVSQKASMFMVFITTFAINIECNREIPILRSWNRYYGS